MDDYTTTPTHLRLFADGLEWFIDGADDAGHFTESCWSYDSHADAAAALAEFVENNETHNGVTFEWRSPRGQEVSA